MPKKPKKPKTRLQSLKSLIAQADKLLQLKFISTNKFCIVCGGSNIVGHHYIFKSQSKILRWDINNLVSLCPGCHTRLHLSGDPMIVQTILKKKGMAWADQLQDKRKQLCKFNKQYLSDIIKELNGELQDL
jgi:hypothetical protein